MAVVSDADREQVASARLAALETDGGAQDTFGADSDEEYQLEASDQGGLVQSPLCPLQLLVADVLIHQQSVVALAHIFHLHVQHKGARVCVLICLQA